MTSCARDVTSRAPFTGFPSWNGTHRALRYHCPSASSCYRISDLDSNDDLINLRAV